MDTETLAKERYVSLTTFKRDGTPVSTPVWVVGDNGSLLVHSAATTWKVKRIRHDPHVRVAACTARGAIRGEPVEAVATIEPDTARVSALLAQKYGIMLHAAEGFTSLQRKLRRQAAPPSVAIRITC